MASPQHLSHFRDPEPPQRFQESIRNVSFSNITCRSPRPVAVVSTEASRILSVQFDNVIIEHIPDELPSLKGNVIDLAPGPQNLEMPDREIGLVIKNAAVRVSNAVKPNGTPVEIYEAKTS
jgi:hypothetical protein